MNKKYYVTLSSECDEFELLKTENREEAIKRAQDEEYYIQRDRRSDRVEVRVYKEDIEDEDCTCFDYDTVFFKENPTIKDLWEASGMNIKSFAEYFGLPYRTVQNWIRDINKCPQYLIELIKYKLINEGIIL